MLFRSECNLADSTCGGKAARWTRGQQPDVLKEIRAASATVKAEIRHPPVHALRQSAIVTQKQVAAGEVQGLAAGVCCQDQTASCIGAVSLRGAVNLQNRAVISDGHKRP